MQSNDVEVLSFEETLYELAKELRTKRRLSLREYFEVFEWANLFTGMPLDGTKRSGIGFEINGVRYGLLFTRRDGAGEVCDGSPDYAPTRVRVREMLERLPDGWGVIVDHGTDGEVRISPDELTELNEGIRIKRVRQEATSSWLAETNQTLKDQGIPLDQRSENAKALWEALNGFRVLPDSRRARRIDWYFAVVADATPTESRARCDARWRDEYASNSYLHHLSDENLQKRFLAIVTNSMFADREALPHELDEREWRELYEHIRFEYERRGLAFRDVIPVAEKLSAWPRFDAARSAFSRYAGPDGQLFRFSELKYLEPLLHEGIVRVFPAASYDDASLLTSQRDDELSRSILVDAAEVLIEHTGRDGVKRPIKAIGSVVVTSRSHANFYVWCTTTGFDPRLFDDFKANACLVIHDAGTFIDRMIAAMSAALPSWVGCSTLVHYFDPLRPGNEVLSARHKDFYYAYQREYRFLWDPTGPDPQADLLQPIDVHLGNLEDVASILKL